MQAMVFNIQRCSIQDGPGIRTTVFFSSCPLRCIWCSNPESQSGLTLVAHNSSLCTRCGRCVEACNSQAIFINDKGLKIDRNKCDNCAVCVSVCYGGALKVYGREMSMEQVVEEVSKDEIYYRNSGGGVTVSGGEPLTQAAFVGEFLKRCRRLGYHIAIDTCGYFNIGEKEEYALNHCDLILFDLKHMDSSTHKKLTGVPNELILENAREISAKGIPLIIRIPIIPGINDAEDNIRAIATFAADIPGVEEVNLLPYHRFGVNKYFMLGREYELRDLEPPTAQHFKSLMEIVESFGFICRCV